MRFKRFTSVFIVLIMLVSVMPVFSMTTYQFDSGMQKGISYFNKGMYKEAADEFQWFCDSNWDKLNDGQRVYVLEYISSAKAKINSSVSLSEKQFNDGLKKGLAFYNCGMYENAVDELQSFCDANWGKMSSSQQKTAFDYLEMAKAKKREDDLLSEEQFNAGLRKGLSYYENAKYKEAMDEFQWFCDANWGKMNSSQQETALDYLEKAKLKYKESLLLTTNEFDSGMKKGINYFNNDMYFEAVDEFQWFCDSMWGRMNQVQRDYILGYLDAAKEKTTEYISMYKYSNGEIISVSVHPNKKKEYSKNGWSVGKPKPKYEINHKDIENKAIKFWKEWLYWPDMATVHNIRVASTWDDWDNGILYATVYIYGTALSADGYYVRGTDEIELGFNKYTGEYWVVEIEEL